MAKQSRRQFNLRRRTEVRDLRAVIVLVCEGQNTEPDYFNQFRRRFNGSMVRLEVIGEGAAPVTIARAAALRKAELDKSRKNSDWSSNDQVWAVFDRDEHPKISDATAVCRAAGVSVAFSDPCFELWLLLHLIDFDRPDDRHQVQRELEANLDCYSRKTRKTADFDLLFDKIEEAERRASSQLARREEEAQGGLNRPYTNVFRLTRVLRGHI